MVQWQMDEVVRRLYVARVPRVTGQHFSFEAKLVHPVASMHMQLIAELKAFVYIHIYMYI